MMLFNYIEDVGQYTKTTYNARRVFKDFVATVKDIGDVQIVDWRNKNGSGEHYIRFTVDEKGYLYITGDVGEAILHAESFTKVTKWANLTLDYFTEKILCTSVRPRFDPKLFRKDFIRLCYENGGYEVDEDWDYEMLNQLSAFVGDNPGGVLPEQMGEDFEAVTEIDNYCEWLNSCGYRYPPRIIYWRVALEMIAEQLKGE